MPRLASNALPCYLGTNSKETLYVKFMHASPRSMIAVNLLPQKKNNAIAPDSFDAVTQVELSTSSYLNSRNLYSGYCCMVGAAIMTVRQSLMYVSCKPPRLPVFEMYCLAAGAWQGQPCRTGNTVTAPRYEQCPPCTVCAHTTCHSFADSCPVISISLLI